MIRTLRPYLLFSLLLHITVFSFIGALAWPISEPGDGTREVRVSLSTMGHGREQSGHVSSDANVAASGERRVDTVPARPVTPSGDARDRPSRKAPSAPEKPAHDRPSAAGGAKDGKPPLAVHGSAEGRDSGSPAPVATAGAGVGDGEGKRSAASALARAKHRARIRHSLGRLLADYFHYPLLARRQGWEGRVVLRIDVSAEGEVSNIRVAQSSGHQVLDESARQAMTRVGAVAALAAGPAIAGMEVPVIYRLRDS